MSLMTRDRLIGTTAVVATGAAMLFGEAAVRPDKTAHADSWKYYVDSSVGEYCEGCCPGGNNLCCPSTKECRIYPD